jgi:hypothetical protein
MNSEMLHEARCLKRVTSRASRAFWQRSYSQAVN